MICYIIAPLCIALLASLILGYILIPYLKSKKLGQTILEIGPRWHKSKEGTPVLGGLLFIGGFIVASAVTGIRLMLVYGDWNMALVFLLAASFGLIGFIDDYVKLFKKRNKGLTPLQKMAMQFIAAIIYLILLKYSGGLSTIVNLPFIGNSIDFGIFYLPLVMLGIVFLTNSTNFTDGIDGLCGTVTAIIMLMFIFMFHYVESPTGMTAASAMLGGLLGFLFFNFHPAKVFMGDTGALFIGGMVCGLAMWLNIPLLIPIFGFIYIIEILSVMIQVTSYKLTKKRVFKMSPIHHHFEISGWGEWKIVIVASLITVAMCVISYFGYVMI